jgi:hypothetical protein
VLAAETSRLSVRLEAAVVGVVLVVAAGAVLLLGAPPVLSPRYVPFAALGLALITATALVAAFAWRARPLRLMAGLAAVGLGLVLVAPRLADHYDLQRLNANMPLEEARLHLRPSDVRIDVAGFCEIYGLYGPDLGRQVEYLTGADDLLDRPLAAGYEAWLKSMRDHRVTAVVVSTDACFSGLDVPQIRWAADHRDTFQPVWTDGTTSVYSLTPIN